MIEPIDDLVDKYLNKADLEDYHPLYKFLPTYKGKRWGFFDDGDQFMLYHRTDVFSDPKLQSAYKAKFGQELRVPETWDEYSQVAQFITDQMAPNVYGAAHFRKFGSPGNQFGFCQQFRANGGKFFDPATMKAQTRHAGRRHDAQADARRQQGLDPWQRRAGRGGAMGGLATGQGRDDLLLAADGADE